MTPHTITKPRTLLPTPKTLTILLITMTLLTVTRPHLLLRLIRGLLTTNLFLSFLP